MGDRSGAQADKSEAAGKVVWGVYNPKEPSVILREITEGTTSILGRDFPLMQEKPLKITDMKVSRKQIEARATNRGLDCSCTGQNAMAYFGSAEPLGGRRKIKTKAKFFFAPRGMVELHFKSRNVNQLRIRQVRGPRAPVVPVGGSNPLPSGASGAQQGAVVAKARKEATSKPKRETSEKKAEDKPRMGADGEKSVGGAQSRASSRDTSGAKAPKATDATTPATKKPTTDATKKAADAIKKAPDVTKGVLDAAKKAPDAAKKAPDAAKKAPDAAKKAPDAAKEAADATKKAPDASKKAADASKKATDATKTDAAKKDGAPSRADHEDLTLAPLERTSSAQWNIDEPAGDNQRGRHGSLSPGSGSRMLLGGSPRIWNGMSPRQRRLSAQSGAAGSTGGAGDEGRAEGGFSWSAALRGSRALGEDSPRRSEDGSSMPGEILTSSRSQSPVFGPPTSETVRTANECPFPSDVPLIASARKANGGASIFASDKHHPHVMSPRVAKRKRSTESAADAAAAVALGGPHDATRQGADDDDDTGGKRRRRRRSSRGHTDDGAGPSVDNDDDDDDDDNVPMPDDDSDAGKESPAAAAAAASGTEGGRTGGGPDAAAAGDMGGRASRRSSISSGGPGSGAAAGTKDEAVINASAASAAKDGGTILPQGPGARVGNDYQVEIPAMLRKVKDLRLVGKGKGSIGAWNKLMHNEPEPLAIDADDREDTTLDWTPAERRAFNKGMYESLKDFISIYRNDPIFRNNGKSPHDLVAYYYKQYKDMPDYARWKAFVTEGSSAGVPPEYSASEEDAHMHSGDVSPRGTDLGAKSSGARGAAEAPPPMVAAPAFSPSMRGGPKGVPGILLDMIKLGFLEPGEDVLQVDYQGLVTKAALNTDGTISVDGLTFDSVSSFSVHCKRKTNPKLSGDNGWLSIVFKGKTLDSIRARYQEKKLALELADQAAKSGGASPAKPAAGAGAETSIGGRASRRASVAGAAPPGAAANLQRSNSTCSTSLPANFGATTRSSVASLGVVGQGPATTTSPWSGVEPSSRRAGGRISTRQQATRQQGFFDLQIESDSDLEDEDAARLPPGVKLANAGPLPVVRTNKKDESMKNLIDSEVLRPGKRVLRVKYKGREFWADLRTDGIIVDCMTDGEYASPSLWSIEIKRRVNPNVRSDSGWYSIFYIPPGSAAAATEIASAAGSGAGGAGGDDDLEKDLEQSNNEDDDDDDDDMRSGIEEDHEESTFENLHAYRKKYRAVREARRQQKMKESYSILSEIKALRAKKQPPAALAAREKDLVTHRYMEAPRLQWRPQTPPSTAEDGTTAEADSVVEEDDAVSVSSRAGGRKKRKRRKGVAARAAALAGPRPPKEPKMYCICQRRPGDDEGSAAASESEGYDSDDGDGGWYLQCGKATGACNGWVHPRCFGFDLTQRDGEKLKEFICPLCSGDGIELRLVKSERNIKDHVAIYAVGTIVMSRVEYPVGTPVGWFPAKIVEVDFSHHADAPYRIVYAFNPLLSEWISLGPNDPTRMLAVDWAKADCYRNQDEQWRKASALGGLKPSAAAASLEYCAGRGDRTDPDMCSDVIQWNVSGYPL